MIMLMSQFLLTLADTEEYYNILAIDGGGIRGLIPAVVLSQMEEYAYEYGIT